MNTSQSDKINNIKAKAHELSRNLSDDERIACVVKAVHCISGTESITLDVAIAVLALALDHGLDPYDFGLNKTAPCADIPWITIARYFSDETAVDIHSFASSDDRYERECAGSVLGLDGSNIDEDSDFERIEDSFISVANSLMESESTLRSLRVAGFAEIADKLTELNQNIVALKWAEKHL